MTPRATTRHLDRTFQALAEWKADERAERIQAGITKSRKLQSEIDAEMKKPAHWPRITLMPGANERTS